MWVRDPYDRGLKGQAISMKDKRIKGHATAEGVSNHCKNSGWSFRRAGRLDFRFDRVQRQG